MPNETKCKCCSEGKECNCKGGDCCNDGSCCTSDGCNGSTVASKRCEDCCQDSCCSKDCCQCCKR